MLTRRDQDSDGHPEPLADTLWAGLVLVLALLAWGAVFALWGA